MSSNSKTKLFTPTTIVICFIIVFMITTTIVFSIYIYKINKYEISHNKNLYQTPIGEEPSELTTNSGIIHSEYPSDYIFDSDGHVNGTYSIVYRAEPIENIKWDVINSNGDSYVSKPLTKEHYIDIDDKHYYKLKLSFKIDKDVANVQTNVHYDKMPSTKLYVDSIDVTYSKPLGKISIY